MKDGKPTEEEMDAVAKKLKQQGKLAEKLMAKKHNLSGIAAIVMAGDMQTMALAEQQMAERNLTVEQASIYVGSFARLQWLADHYEKGDLDDTWLVHEFPKEWSYTDHFGANPLFLRLWVKAFEKHGKRTLVVGDKPMPAGDPLCIYRGQDYDMPLGYSWTLDKEVAAAFASGRGSRQSDREKGVLIEGRVARRKVLGYIESRKEEEIVVDPRYVKVVGWYYHIVKHIESY